MSKETLTRALAAFGLDDFRPDQREIITATMQRQDVFVTLPTGGGKSLCFQLPARIEDGLTVVICPIRSLIQDQVQALSTTWGARVDYIDGTRSLGDRGAILERLTSGDVGGRRGLRLLYTTPEQLVVGAGCGRPLLDALKRCHAQKKLMRLVVDEAHCVSGWGHDFRPAFGELGEVRGHFEGVPCLALSATLTTRTLDECKSMLGMADALEIRRPSKRANLYYEVRKKQGGQASAKSIATILRLEGNGAGAAIVYCARCSECDRVAQTLQNEGVMAEAYHGKKSTAGRNWVQERWMKNQVRAVVATNAFGMGVDKPDVRWVFHHTMPGSMEAYVQETGRAGRDGEAARCIMYYKEADRRWQHCLLAKSEGASDDGRAEARHAGVTAMERLAVNRARCIQQLIQEGMGEHVETGITCGQCAICCQPESESTEWPPPDLQPTPEMINAARSILESTETGCLTNTKLVGALKGRRDATITEHRECGSGKEYSDDELGLLIGMMREAGHLRERYAPINNWGAAYVHTGPVPLDNQGREQWDDKNVVKWRPRDRPRTRSCANGCVTSGSVPLPGDTGRSGWGDASVGPTCAELWPERVHRCLADAVRCVKAREARPATLGIPTACGSDGGYSETVVEICEAFEVGMARLDVDEEEHGGFCEVGRVCAYLESARGSYGEEAGGFEAWCRGEMPPLGTASTQTTMPSQPPPEWMETLEALRRCGGEPGGDASKNRLETGDGEPDVRTTLEVLRAYANQADPQL